MPAIEVTANKGSRSATVSYDFGENLQDAVAKFGEEVVFTNMQQSMKISLQALLRRGFDKGQSDEEIAAAAGALSWLLCEKVAGHRSSALGLASGAVSGLVGITPAAGFVGPQGALAVDLALQSRCRAQRV